MRVFDFRFEKMGQGQQGRSPRTVSFLGAYLFSILIIGTMLLSSRFALANDCALMFLPTTTASRILLSRISVQPRELSERERELAPELQPGGRLRISEKPLSSAPNEALPEIVAMVGATRQKTFSLKDYDRGGPADTGTLTLGLPLVGQYSIEATYTADFRGQGQFNLSNIKLIPPYGKPINISSNPLTIEGKINPRAGLDLSMFPDLAKFDLTAKLPATMDMQALEKFEATKNQLHFLTKEEMRAASQGTAYAKLRWLMIKRFVQAKMIEYHVKGVFKRYVALVSAPLVVFAVYYMLPDGTWSSIQEKFSNPDPFVVDKALSDFANSANVPDPIREQIESLRVETLNTIDPTGTRSRELTRQNTLNLNAEQRFDVAKGQSIWVQTVQDPKTRESSSVMFLSRFNGSNQIEVAAVPLDEKRHRALIYFVQSRGEFMPQSREELRQ